MERLGPFNSTICSTEQQISLHFDAFVNMCVFSCLSSPPVLSSHTYRGFLLYAQIVNGYP